MSPMVTLRNHAKYYFFLFASLGIVSPYIGWWAGQVARPEDVFWILACFYITMIASPSLWGHIAFSGNRPGRWLATSTLVSAIFALGLTQVSVSPVIASCFLMFAFGMFYSPLVSLADSIAYIHLEEEAAYSRVRLFGSLGFLCFSTVIGGLIVLEYVETFPFLVCMSILVAWVASAPYKKSVMVFTDENGEAPAKISVKGIFVKLLPLWIVACLSQICFTLYYVYFAQHLKASGFSSLATGTLIGFSTLCEIFVFWKIKWFFKRAKPWLLIGLVSAVSALRWIGIGLIHDPSWLSILMLFGLQSLHAVGFPVYHTASLKIIHESVPSSQLGVAQGFYNALGYGIAGVVGVGIGALLWPFGGFAIFATAFCLALIVSLLAFFYSGLFSSGFFRKMR